MAWLKILRIPNLFIAAADILAGFLLVAGLPDEILPSWWLRLAALLLTSLSLYAAGLVLNDYYDRDVDASERPERPIPSGEITPSAAKIAGWAALLTGVLLGWGAAYAFGSLLTGCITTVLALLVVGYDVGLKSTPLGPFVMGGCRSLNLALGMSFLPISEFATWHYLAIAGVGLYIAGITLFARHEAADEEEEEVPLRQTLALPTGTVLSLLGLTLLWVILFFVGDQATLITAHGENILFWHILWVLFAGLLLFRNGRAILRPAPQQIQIAVMLNLQTLILLDATLVFLFRDIVSTTIVAALIIPTLVLSLYFRGT